MESICKTQCRNLIIGNRYGGLPKRFTRRSTSKVLRIVSIRKTLRRNAQRTSYLPYQLRLVNGIDLLSYSVVI